MMDDDIQSRSSDAATDADIATAAEEENDDTGTVETSSAQGDSVTTLNDKILSNITTLFLHPRKGYQFNLFKVSTSSSRSVLYPVYINSMQDFNKCQSSKTSNNHTNQINLQSSTTEDENDIMDIDDNGQMVSASPASNDIHTSLGMDPTFLKNDKSNSSSYISFSTSLENNNGISNNYDDDDDFDVVLHMKSKADDEIGQIKKIEKVSGQCQFLDCTRNVSSKYKYCYIHGGGKLCKQQNCKYLAHGSSNNCKQHSEDNRCKYPGCNNKNSTRHGFCHLHEGAKPCEYNYCTNKRLGKSKYCKEHGGGRLCKSEGCNNHVFGESMFCSDHSISRASLLSRTARGKPGGSIYVTEFRKKRKSKSISNDLDDDNSNSIFNDENEQLQLSKNPRLNSAPKEQKNSIITSGKANLSGKGSTTKIAEQSIIKNVNPPKMPLIIFSQKLNSVKDVDDISFSQGFLQEDQDIDDNEKESTISQTVQIKNQELKKMCNHPGCTKPRMRYSRFCQEHKVESKCSIKGCDKSTVGVQPFCQYHRGMKVCEVDGCHNAAVFRSKLCTEHGGVTPCKFYSCTMPPADIYGFCSLHKKYHKPCKYPGCMKNVISVGDLCSRHRMKCHKENCQKSAIYTSPFCSSHTVISYCKAQYCKKRALNGAVYCIKHERKLDPTANHYVFAEFVESSGQVISVLSHLGSKAKNQSDEESSISGSESNNNDSNNNTFEANDIDDDNNEENEDDNNDNDDDNDNQTNMTQMNSSSFAGDFNPSGEITSPAPFVNVMDDRVSENPTPVENEFSNRNASSEPIVQE